MTTLRMMSTLVIVLMLLPGCKPAPPPQEVVEEVELPPAVELVGTNWVAESVAGQPVGAGFASTVFFETDERVTGNAGCNEYFGSWGTDGEGIAFGHIGATMMSCPDEQMAQEQSFMEALSAAERFEIQDGKLLIFSSGSDGPSVLRPQPVAAAEPTDG